MVKITISIIFIVYKLYNLYVKCRTIRKKGSFQGKIIISYNINRQQQTIE